MSNSNSPIYCPFCNCTDRRVSVRRMGNKGYRVVCGKCGASGPYVAKKDWHDNKFIAQGQAIKLWNTRESNASKLIERIMMKLEEVTYRYQSLDVDSKYINVVTARNILNEELEVYNNGKTVQKLQEQETAEGRNPESQAGEC